MKPLDDHEDAVRRIDQVLSALLAQPYILVNTELGGEWYLTKPYAFADKPSYYLRPGHFYDTLDLMTEALRVAHAAGLVKEDKSETA